MSPPPPRRASRAGLPKGRTSKAAQPAAKAPYSDQQFTSRGSRSRERTRRKLIESAHRTIAAKGFDTTTIEDITRGADVGFGTFYNHFSSKEDIASALFEIRAQELGAIVDEINSHEQSKVTAIAYIQKVFLTRALQDPVWGWFIVRTQSTHQHMKEFFGTRAVNDIRDGVKQGHFTVSCVDTAARLTLSSLIGAMRWLLEGNPPKGMVNHTTECLMRMYGLPEDEAKRVSRLPLPSYVLDIWEQEVDFHLLTRT